MGSNIVETIIAAVVVAVVAAAAAVVAAVATVSWQRCDFAGSIDPLTARMLASTFLRPSMLDIVAFAAASKKLKVGLSYF